MSQPNVRLSRSALDKFSGPTDVGRALLPVLCALSRPRVANLQLNQQPVKAFLLILASLRLSVYAVLVQSPEFKPIEHFFGGIALIKNVIVQTGDIVFDQINGLLPSMLDADFELPIR